MAHRSGGPPAGWYPNPHGAGRLRFWDGSKWTTLTRPVPGRPDELRQREWEHDRPWWDLDVPRAEEGPYTGGFPGNYRNARLAVRLGRRGPWIALLTLLALVVGLYLYVSGYWGLDIVVMVMVMVVLGALAFRAVESRRE